MDELRRCAPREGLRSSEHACVETLASDFSTALLDQSLVTCLRELPRRCCDVDECCSLRHPGSPDDVQAPVAPTRRPGTMDASAMAAAIQAEIRRQTESVDYDTKSVEELKTSVAGLTEKLTAAKAALVKKSAGSSSSKPRASKGNWPDLPWGGARAPHASQ